MFRGGNLIFIFGPPRSGTTWLLNLLKAHPDVVAATVDNLDVRIRPGTTLETNAFQERRPFTDEELRERFARLSEANPGCRVVEKTPVHVFEADRIRRIFPDSALVLTVRDGRDVVNSMLHISRDPDRWWKAVPDTAAGAALMWLSYAEAGARCVEAHDPHVVSYESLIADPGGCLTELLEALGLSTESVPVQLRAAQGGKGIPLAGVYREGSSGTWRRDLSERELDEIDAVAGSMLRRLGYGEEGARGRSR